MSVSYAWSVAIGILAALLLLIRWKFTRKKDDDAPRWEALNPEGIPPKADKQP
jgi:hypothetical protein